MARFAPDYKPHYNDAVEWDVPGVQWTKNSHKLSHSFATPTRAKHHVSVVGGRNLGRVPGHPNHRGVGAPGPVYNLPPPDEPPGFSTATTERFTGTRFPDPSIVGLQVSE